MLANQPDPADVGQVNEGSRLKRRTAFLRMTAGAVLWPPDMHECKGKGAIGCCETPPLPNFYYGVLLYCSILLLVS